MTPASKTAVWLILLATLLGTAGCRKSAPGEKGSPAGAVRAMSRFSREGRVEEYLDCFSGKLRAELEQARDEMKTEAFADALRRRAEPVRGIAISGQTALDANTTRLNVEWVFEDRNEIQTFTVRKAGSAWKIVAMTDAQYRKPEFPYGAEALD